MATSTPTKPMCPRCESPRIIITVLRYENAEVERRYWCVACNNRWANEPQTQGR